MTVLYEPRASFIANGKKCGVLTTNFPQENISVFVNCCIADVERTYNYKYKYRQLSEIVFRKF